MRIMPSYENEGIIRKQKFGWIGCIIEQNSVKCWSLTYDVDEREEFTEEVSVGPPVVVLQVVGEVVEQQSFLLALLHVLHDADVQVHHERVDLPRLPVLPQPAGDVEQEGLQREREKRLWIAGRVRFHNVDTETN